MNQHFFFAFLVVSACPKPDDPANPSTDTDQDSTMQVPSSSGHTGDVVIMSEVTTATTWMTDPVEESGTTVDKYPDYCLDDPGVECVAPQETWCQVLDRLCEQHGMKVGQATTCTVLQIKCERVDPLCETCFYLEQGCITGPGTDCDGLMEICGCLGDAIGIM